MATLIAIGYPDETTALAAEEEARQLAQDLIIQPDAFAVVSRKQVREVLEPGTSASFLIVEHATADKALEALSQYDGTVLKYSLAHEDEQRLQEVLHGGEPAPQT